MWRELIVLLQQLRDAYARCIEIGKKKHNALVGLDFQTLDALNKQEEKLTGEIRQLEEKRLKLMAELSKEQAGIEQDIKLSKLLAKLPSSPIRSSLYTLYAELSENVKQAKQLSEDNRVLIRAAMSAVSYHLNRVGGVRANSTYGSRGDEDGTQRQNLDFQA
jgi:flagellar biosynthesis/type III secretory pathway chaperone